MEAKKNEDYCNEVVFSNFYRANTQSLFNYIYYKCGNEQLAEDIAQDAFIKFWNNCSKVLSGKATSFLFTIANNLFLNEFAKSKVVIGYKQEQTNNHTNESPEFLLEEKEFSIKLQKAIANLTETQRVTFLMNRIDGFKYREIAEKLNISVKAVEKRMHGALQSLRNEIENI